MKIVFGPLRPVEEALVMELIRDCQVVHLEMDLSEEFDDVFEEIRAAIVKEDAGNITQTWDKNGDITLKVEVGA